MPQTQTPSGWWLHPHNINIGDHNPKFNPKQNALDTTNQPLSFSNACLRGHEAVIGMRARRFRPLLTKDLSGAGPC